MDLEPILSAFLGQLVLHSSGHPTFLVSGPVRVTTVLFDAYQDEERLTRIKAASANGKHVYIKDAQTFKLTPLIRL